MRCWLVLTVMILGCVPNVASMAQGRPSTTTMSCTAAASFIVSRGAVVIGTGGDTFERAVVHQGFCNMGEYTKPLFARTRDLSACFVGYYCFDGSRNDDR